MINSVRNTVLSVLNKNNYGYLSPSDFNLFAKQAQLDIFENYFYEYNYQRNKENARQSGTGEADIRKGIEEVLDYFSVTAGLYTQRGNTFSPVASPLVNNLYSLPSPSTTGSDYYLLNKVLIYQSIIDEGQTTATVGGQNKIIDTNADFTIDVSVGDIAAVENAGVQYLTILSVNSPTEITVSGNFINAIGLSYTIIAANSKMQEAEKVTHSKITMLNNSILTSPTIQYPAYTQENGLLSAYPNTLTSVGQVMSQYFRYPLPPRWTYLQLTNGEPVFDQNQPDFQNFELPQDDEVNLIIKILQYAGISIREGDVYQFAQAEETQNTQEEN
jgi:hypothetical protein